MTVNKCNNTYHITIKMKPVDVKPSICTDFNKGHNKEGPKFKVGDNVRISKYKNTSAKCNVPNWSEEVFVMKKFRNTVFRGHMLLMILTEKKLFFFKKNKSEKV